MYEKRRTVLSVEQEARRERDGLKVTDQAGSEWPGRAFWSWRNGIAGRWGIWGKKLIRGDLGVRLSGPRELRSRPQ